MKKVFSKKRLGLFLTVWEKNVRNFKNQIFPIKNIDKIPISDPTPKLTAEPMAFAIPKPTKEWTKKYLFKWHETFCEEHWKWWKKHK